MRSSSIIENAIEKKDVTILSNNCAGGILYHQLGMKFNSPTINLFLKTNDFLELVKNLREYEHCELIEDVSTQEAYPVGILKGENLKPIKIKFIHYQSFNEAKQKWIERYKRINYDNICIIMETGISTTDKVKNEFQKLPYDKKVIIVDEEDGLYPEAFFVDIYKQDYSWGKLLFQDTYYGKGQYLNLDRFDYVEFLNSGVIQSA